MSRLKAVQPVTQRADQPDQVTEQPRSPYLTSREALVYLRLPSLSALYSHIRENHLPVCRCGGDLRFDTRELDAWLRGFGSAVEMNRSHAPEFVLHKQKSVRGISGQLGTHR